MSAFGPSPVSRSGSSLNDGGKRPGLARSSVGISRDWRVALDMALAGIRDIGPDAIYVFVSAAFDDDLPEIAEAVWHHAGSMIVIGCSSSGVIGRGAEMEQEPAISLLSLELPGAILRPVRFTQGMLQDASSPATGTRPPSRSCASSSIAIRSRSAVAASRS